ncbi:MAG: NYN domain-containing protein [Acidimicrobiales bacterium]
MSTVSVFIDGQNLYKGVSKLFRKRVHPVLLARELAGDRELLGASYYSGIHDPRENPKIHAMAMRRHKLIRATGVDVIERTLSYHWEWGVVDRLPKPHHAEDGETHEVTVAKQRRAREKGIDLALGLDAVEAALTKSCDTIVIVSRDRDLAEVAREVHERAASRQIRVEVAVPAGENQYVMEGYDYSHFIDAKMVDRIADNFDYFQKLPKAQVNKFLESLSM